MGSWGRDKIYEKGDAVIRKQNLLSSIIFIFVFQATAEPSLTLPAGWEERHTAYGRTYYVNQEEEEVALLAGW